MLATPAAGAAKLDRATSQRLDRALDQTLAKITAPGVAVGVWVGEKGWTAVRGITKRGERRTPTLGDHTRIGSITKTFTGTVVLQLVDEGKLKLDETIQQWFPLVPEAGKITIRDLGDMSSGINTYVADKEISDRYLDDPTKPWKPEQLIDAGVGLPRTFAPGDGFFYSDTNTLMLGQIVEDVTGKPIGRVLRERIFAPLKLRGTSYPANSKIPAPFWNGYTNQDETGTKVRDTTDWSPTFAGAAGQAISTLPDLHRWTVVLGTGSLLSPGAQRDRLRPNPASVAAGREYDFCLGRDHGWLTHVGDIPGYNSQLAYLPKLRATIVVLVNTDIESQEALPAPLLTTALTKVISPANVTTGTH